MNRLPHFTNIKAALLNDYKFCYGCKKLNDIDAKICECGFDFHPDFITTREELFKYYRNPTVYLRKHKLTQL